MQNLFSWSCPLCNIHKDYDDISVHCIEHYDTDIKNVFDINQSQNDIVKCAQCGLPDFAIKIKTKEHKCIDKAIQNKKNIGIYLYKLNDEYKTKTQKMLKEYNDKRDNIKKILLDSFLIFKEKRDNARKNELIKGIVQKNNNIAELQYQIENFSNLLSQAEQYANITKDHTEHINQIVTQYNQLHFSNADHINKTLKAFISSKLSDQAFNPQQSKIKSSTAVESSKEKEANVMINQPIKEVTCSICKNKFNKEETQKCYYEKCDKEYCNKCYSLNKHQVRTSDYPCNFYTCCECGNDNICIMNTVFCAHCQFRICAECYREKHIEHN